MTHHQLQNKLIAEISKQMEDCEPGILAVGMNEYDMPIAALTRVAPNSIVFTHVLALLPDGTPFLNDVGLN